MKDKNHIWDTKASAVALRKRIGKFQDVQCRPRLIGYLKLGTVHGHTVL
jgi:hypothetical protein